MKKQLFGLLGAGLLATSAVDAQIRTTPIDGFDTDQAEVVSTGAPASNSASAPVAGANREITVTRTDGSLGVRASVGTGAFLYSQDTGVSGTGQVDWTNLPGLDFEFQDEFVLLIRRSDFAAPISLTVSSAGGSATVSRTIPQLATNQELVFDFGGQSGVDLSAITGLRLDVDGSSVPDLDLQVDQRAARGPGRCTIAGLGDLAANDPDCRIVNCPFDSSLTADDPLCVECAFVSGILASDPACVAPPPVPGMTVSGLWASLIGLPLIAGFFVRRRRSKK